MNSERFLWILEYNNKEYTTTRMYQQQQTTVTTMHNVPPAYQPAYQPMGTVTTNTHVVNQPRGKCNILFTRNDRIANI